MDIGRLQTHRVTQSHGAKLTENQTCTEQQQMRVLAASRELHFIQDSHLQREQLFCDIVTLISLC